MPNFDITLNIYIVLLLIIASFGLGCLPRKRQLGKKQRKIVELERELVQAYAEVLDTQREFLQLEAKIKDITNPVIPMKSNKLEENNRPTGTD
jgi:hypothetical protein